MELKEALNDGESLGRLEEAMNMDDVFSILEKGGTKTTEEELAAILALHEDGELTDETLEGVAGGMGAKSILMGPLIQSATQEQIRKQLLIMNLAQYPLLQKLLGVIMNDNNTRRD